MAQHRISRRTALVTGAGAAVAGILAAGGYELVEAGTLPGKYRLAKLMGACGGPPPPPAGPAPVRHLTRFYSRYRRQNVSMVTVIPAGISSPAGLPVVLDLHGLGGDAAGTAAGASRGMAALTGPLARSFAMLTVDGGATYWHKRADGDDPQGMIIHEVLPRAAALGLRTDRIGIVGDSMGGYGALLLAERLSRGRPAAVAVAAISPAVFASYPDAHQADARAFDGPGDFARNDIFTGLARLRDIPAYVACGTDDPFEPMARLVRARLERLTGHPAAGVIEAGCHDDAFWARHLPTALTFIGRYLPH
jgi:pimeloyl-ACP methyl ester carboxylesterase